MARDLYALLPEDADKPVWFAVADGRGWRVIDEASLPSGPVNRLIAFAPSTAVTCHRAALSARSERQAQLAAGFAVEDELAQPVEQVHAVPAVTQGPGDERDIYVVANGLMEAWVSRLGEVGAASLAIIPELSLLGPDRTWLDLAGRRLILKDGRRYGVDLSLPEDLLRALLADEAGPVSPRTDGETLTELISLHVPEGQVDLCQGRFARKRSGLFSGAVDLRMPAMALASLLLVWTGVISVEIRALKQDAAGMRALASGVYAGLYPEEGAVDDPAARIRARSAAASPAALDFEQAAAALYEAVLASEGVSVQSIRYDARDASLRASLVLQSYGDDARLGADLEKSGLTVSVGDSRQEQGQVVGEIILRAGA